MKNIIKRAMFGLTSFGLTALTFAQETTNTELDQAFTKFMNDLKTSISDKLVEMLPVLGYIAGAALIVFIAIWLYRKVKTFMGR